VDAHGRGPCAGRAGVRAQARTARLVCGRDQVGVPATEDLLSDRTRVRQRIGLTRIEPRCRRAGDRGRHLGVGRSGRTSRTGRASGPDGSRRTSRPCGTVRPRRANGPGRTGRSDWSGRPGCADGSRRALGPRCARRAHRPRWAGSTRRSDSTGRACGPRRTGRPLRARSSSLASRSRNALSAYRTLKSARPGRTATAPGHAPLARAAAQRAPDQSHVSRSGLVAAREDPSGIRNARARLLRGAARSVGEQEQKRQQAQQQPVRT